MNHNQYTTKHRRGSSPYQGKENAFINGQIELSFPDYHNGLADSVTNEKKRRHGKPAEQQGSAPDDTASTLNNQF